MLGYPLLGLYPVIRGSNPESGRWLGLQAGLKLGSNGLCSLVLFLGPIEVQWGRFGNFSVFGDPSILWSVLRPLVVGSAACTVRCFINIVLQVWFRGTKGLLCCGSGLVHPSRLYAVSS